MFNLLKLVRVLGLVPAVRLRLAVVQDRRSRR